jgi:hypothetical protein
MNVVAAPRPRRLYECTTINTCIARARFLDHSGGGEVGGSCKLNVVGSVQTLKRVNSKIRMSMNAASTFTRTADDVSSGSDVDIEDRSQTVKRSLDAPPADEVKNKLSITVDEKMPLSEEEVDDDDDETPTPTSRGRHKSPCVLLLLLLLLLLRIHSPSCAT